MIFESSFGPGVGPTVSNRYVSITMELVITDCSEIDKSSRDTIRDPILIKKPPLSESWSNDTTIGRM
eukprot:2058543-Amphidinium_carterae.1